MARTVYMHAPALPCFNDETNEMSDMDTLALLREFLKKHSGQDPEKVTPESTLASLKIDSLTLLELIFEFEGKFGISIPNDFPAPETVQDLLGFVDELRANATEKSN